MLNRRAVAGTTVGVSAAWIVLGVVLGSQAALGETMQGNPVVLTDAIRGAVVNNLPWIPATLVAIATALRFPVTRLTWKRAVPVHLLVIPAASWIANVGVVLTFGATINTLEGLAALARGAAFWGTVRIHMAALVYIVSVALTYIGMAILVRWRERSLARAGAQRD